MENLGKWAGTTETSIINRIQEVEEWISDWRHHRENRHIDQRKCQIQQILNTKLPENLGHDEKTKPKNNRGRRRSRIKAPWHRKYIQQNYRRKLSQPKVGHTYEGRRSI